MGNLDEKILIKSHKNLSQILTASQEFWQKIAVQVNFKFCLFHHTALSASSILTLYSPSLRSTRLRLVFTLTIFGYGFRVHAACGESLCFQS